MKKLFLFVLILFSFSLYSQEKKSFNGIVFETIPELRSQVGYDTNFGLNLGFEYFYENVVSSKSSLLFKAGIKYYSPDFIGLHLGAEKRFI